MYCGRRRQHAALAERDVLALPVHVAGPDHALGVVDRDQHAQPVGLAPRSASASPAARCADRTARPRRCRSGRADPEREELRVAEQVGLVVADPDRRMRGAAARERGAAADASAAGAARSASSAQQESDDPRHLARRRAGGKLRRSMSRARHVRASLAILAVPTAAVKIALTALAVVACSGACSRRRLARRIAGSTRARTAASAASGAAWQPRAVDTAEDLEHVDQVDARRRRRAARARRRGSCRRRAGGRGRRSSG